MREVLSAFSRWSAPFPLADHRLPAANRTGLVSESEIRTHPCRIGLKSLMQPCGRRPAARVACELRTLREHRIMAAKVKMLTLLQEIRGFAQISNRRPPPQCSGLTLAQLRLQGKRAALRRRRLNIAIDPPTQPDIPLQVKIHHVRPDSASPASAPAP